MANEKMWRRRVTAGCLTVLLLLPLLASCGTTEETDETKPLEDAPDTTPKEESAAETEPETTPEPEYIFPQAYQGEEIRVLNIEDIFSMHGVIDTGETTGDTLNDKMYNAVRTLEEKTGIVWKEENIDLQNEFPKMLPQLITGGVDEYDIIYENMRDYYTFASQGYYYNLYDYDEIHLDSDWFISTYNNANQFRGKLYTALGYSNLTVIDAIGCLNFNQTMAENLGLEMPYDLVREGKWTLDELEVYLKAAANLNGDDSFKWTDSGKCVWGMVISQNAATWWPNRCGEMSVDNIDGELVLTAGTERFYNVCERLASLIGGSEGQVYIGHWNGDDLPGSYINCFEVGRAMFGGSEVAKANRMRDIDFDFGVLPYPKYDETQERYYSGVSYPASGVSIPVTCMTPERSAAIGDAINYIFYKDVWPTFREVTLEHKNMRNEDSIEMLGIVLNSIYPVASDVFKVSSAYFNELCTKINTGNPSFASTFASYKSMLESDIKKVNEGAE